MLQKKHAYCPYCGENIILLLDPSAGSQSYYEDCSVCCRPIKILIHCKQELKLESIELLRDDE